MFTVGYGVGNIQTRDENNYRALSQVLSDTSLQAALSFDPNQVDARVNGTIVDLNAGVTANMRIELIKKAGRKSAEELVLENQLRPIGVATETLVALDQHVSAAIEPFYDALNKAEVKAGKDIAAAQRAVVKECKPFGEFVDAIIEQLVDTNYVDSVGGLTIPVAVREELAIVATEGEKTLEAPRKALADAEKAAHAWAKSTIADISMSVTVKDQRALVAKALSANPLKAWKFEA